jgi:hypothetical protein
MSDAFDGVPTDALLYQLEKRINQVGALLKYLPGRSLGDAEVPIQQLSQWYADVQGGNAYGARQALLQVIADASK